MNNIDVLGEALRVLFVGFNPSLRSEAIGHPYAGRGNHFWRLLAAAGLTPAQLAPTDSAHMLASGLGSTNLVERATASAAELSRSELRAGVPRLRDIVHHTQPRVVAYTGKGVYLAASGRSRAPWGKQDEALFPGSIDFVLPSPSGLVRMTFAEKLVWYQALAQTLAE
ncbi:MAG: mismatch-specific DNA-glycosylase [Spongiibacteraceae bacterium]|jgi:TDG/mug DNA glycosylase family protein|nr:mismatch-specific DNA-glycosylase [Spongiibacteraceae bacterium]